MLTVTLPDRLGPAGLAAPAIVFDGFVGDFAAVSPGGLSPGDPIRSAVVMLLFTDAACAPEDLRFEHAGDRRGWAGDGFGLDQGRGEQPLGSRLWLLRRSVLDRAVAQAAEIEAVRALQPLVAQGIAREITAMATIAGRADRLDLAIALKARDGRPVYSDRFDLVWKAAA